MDAPAAGDGYRFDLTSGPSGRVGDVRTAGRPLATPFETMRWEAGSLHRWPRHRDRLARSAAALDLPFDGEAAWAAVRDAVRLATGAGHGGARSGAPQGPLRVRLDLREDGRFDAEAHPHLDDDRRHRRVAWADTPVRSDDPARRHKTRDRALYDEAAAWARGLGLADVLFLNERGLLAEGAISNVFVVGGDGRWRTPPVRDGALPGVLRAEMLELGEAVEAHLRPDDLRGARLAIGSALRGLREVALDPSLRWLARGGGP